MVLITGAGGMLGSYLSEVFIDDHPLRLGLNRDDDYCVDLTKSGPEFDRKFSLVVHAAGTEAEKDAMTLNYEGTRNLLESLENNPPEYFVYISSRQVYSRDAGEDLDEDTNTWATSEAGKSKALAEELVKEWCSRNDVTLTIIRPARMFGNGVKGETLQLFNDALNGRYIHIRDNNAKESIVCAYDVARGIKALYKQGGIFNAADPNPVRFIDMVEAMTCNAGAKKRMTHLPAPWAEWVWRLLRWVPWVDRNLSPGVVENRMKTLTLNGSKFAEKSGVEYFDTISVIEHKAKDYPYSYNSKKESNGEEV